MILDLLRRRRGLSPRPLEVRLVVRIGLLLAVLGVASAMSSTVEHTLNLWIGIPVAALTVLGLLFALAKELWAWVRDLWEER